MSRRWQRGDEMLERLPGRPGLGVINAVRLMVQNSASVVGTAICLTLLAVGYRVTYGFMFALSLAGLLASLASKRVHRHESG